MAKGLSVVNQKEKLSEWAERLSACRSSGSSVRAWRQENGVSEHTYYRWQRRLYDLAQAEREKRFAEITPQRQPAGGIAVTVLLGGMELAAHNGADATTVETVQRAVKSC